MSLTLMPAPPRGRPPVSDSPPERAKHLLCALSRLKYRVPAWALARTHGVTRQTVNRWVRLALTYDGPEADELRRLAEASR